MDCSKTEFYIKEKFRMCHAMGDCDECELLNDASYGREDCEYPTDVKKAIAIVQKWSDEHPSKTYAQDFFKKFPKAKPDKDGVPRICRANCYGGSCQHSAISGVGPAPCAACWGEPFEEV